MFVIVFQIVVSIFVCLNLCESVTVYIKLYVSICRGLIVFPIYVYKTSNCVLGCICLTV